MRENERKRQRQKESEGNSSKQTLPVARRAFSFQGTTQGFDVHGTLECVQQNASSCRNELNATHQSSFLLITSESWQAEQSIPRESIALCARIFEISHKGTDGELRFPLNPPFRSSCTLCTSWISYAVFLSFSILYIACTFRSVCALISTSPKFSSTAARGG